MGTTSPYPTVARETVAHQREAVILEKTSGWASFSKKYIAKNNTAIIVESPGNVWRLEEDGILINGLGKNGTFKASEINSHGDHRIAMASSIGSLRSDGETSVLDCLNVNTSFPNFIDVCKEVGINIEKT